MSGSLFAASAKRNQRSGVATSLFGHLNRDEHDSPICQFAAFCEERSALSHPIKF
jgi:hypothetical protein